MFFALAITLITVQFSQAVAGVAEPSAPAPTFEHLSLLWPVDSVDDSEVRVRFRVLGQTDWRPAMPLFATPAHSNAGHSWSARHAGSLFGLQPGTAHEIELQRFQAGQLAETRILQASTRVPMQPAVGGTLRPATPATLSSVLANVEPGDIVLLGSGVYPGFSPSRDGTDGQVITLRGQPGARIEGEIGLFFRQYWLLEDLHVVGRIRLNGSSDVAVRRSRVDASPTLFNGDTIVCFLRCERLHLADNTLNGTTVWAESSLGVDGDNRGEGIVVTGPGHVIERNTVIGFRDAISLLEGAEAVDQYSIDILDNTIEVAADDGIEADFCAHNCRSVGNRMTDVFIAWSAQPTLGGPNYAIGNSAYNVVHVAFKLYRSSRGDVLLHNTVVKNGDGFGAYPGVPIAHLYARNNLFFGGAGGSWGGFSSGTGRVIDLATLVLAGASLDYNGYGSEVGFSGRFGPITFQSLTELRQLTSEQHAQQLSRLPTFADPVPYPLDPMQRNSTIDLQLATGSAAIDTGVLLPNINDDHAGQAPDLGAFEYSSAAMDALFDDGFEGP